jgi:hypothetical protein
MLFAVPLPGGFLFVMVRSFCGDHGFTSPKPPDHILYIFTEWDHPIRR